MTEVKWDEIQHVYEDMVSLLLSRLHPDAERIDGSGGDGGRLLDGWNGFWRGLGHGSQLAAEGLQCPRAWCCSSGSRKGVTAARAWSSVFAWRPLARRAASAWPRSHADGSGTLNDSGSSTPRRSASESRRSAARLRPPRCG